MASLGSLADWILALAATVGSALVGLFGVVGKNRQRSMQNERYLEGTDDPNNDGVLEIAHETRRNLEDFRKETRKEHREVMNRLEDVADAVESDD